MVRGILVAQLGEFERSSEDFERAYRIDPHLSFLGASESILVSQQHDTAKALATFRRAAQEHPNEALTQYLLAEALREAGSEPGTVDYRQEMAFARRAVKLDPSLVEAHDLLSEIYVDGGRLDDAIEECRIALKQDANDQQALYHLIIALKKTGQTSEVPSLVKQLVALKTADSTTRPEHQKFRLVEGIESSTSPAPVNETGH